MVAVAIAIHWDQPPYLANPVLAMVALALAVRAVIIPSPALRTLGIGLASAAGIAGFAFHYHAQSPAVEGMMTRGLYVAFDTIIALSWVAVTTLTSWTLFGLRRRVRDATQLGQYTLHEKIGEGGMGVVYKAQHAMLRRATAVKLLPTGKAGAHDVARFEREVQLTSALTHPNTIQIYDYGRTLDGTFYYAMEYLDGVTLQSLVELDGPQPAARVIALLSQVCASLAEAHSIGLIHRDIKPANILLCERGRLADVVKVLDFGLVKVVGDSAAANLSREGTLAGTPLYMAPEAITSPDEVDGRTDLYALGAVGYFLVTGHEVFEGQSLVEICAHHLHTPPEPPSRRLGSAVPADLEAVLLSCLAKLPRDRPGDAEALNARLMACADASGWAEDRRRLWWRSHGESLRAKRAAAVAVSGTIGPFESLEGTRVGRA
jgi:serine/threonine-protein kinase